VRQQELINLLSQRANISRKEAWDIIRAFTDAVTETLVQGQKVTIPNFGVFTLSRLKAKTAINPSTGQHIQIPEMTIPRFRASTKLKRMMKGGDQQPGV